MATLKLYNIGSGIHLPRQQSQVMQVLSAKQISRCMPFSIVKLWFENLTKSATNFLYLLTSDYILIHVVM